MLEYEILIKELLSNPEKLKLKKPFTRGLTPLNGLLNTEVSANEDLYARLPSYRRQVVTQEQFLMELDPNSHACLFDDNIPSIFILFNLSSIILINSSFTMVFIYISVIFVLVYSPIL